MSLLAAPHALHTAAAAAAAAATSFRRNLEFFEARCVPQSPTRVRPPLPRSAPAWNTLPLELMQRTLELLDAGDALRCMQTCRAWRRLQQHAPLWRKLRASTAAALVRFPQRLADRDAVLRVARLTAGCHVTPLDTAAESDTAAASAKVVVTGASGSGTSCLVDRFHLGTFPSVRPAYSDLAVRALAFTARRGAPPIHAKLVDIRDEVRPSPFPSTRLWSTSTALLVTLDLTDAASVDRARLILDKKRRYLPGLFDSMPIALVGCKADQHACRQVTSEHLDWLVHHYHLPYFETSALTGDNVRAPFLYVLKRLCHVLV